MDLTNLRKLLYTITKRYFVNSEVRWGEQNSGASHDLPFIRLKLENVKREQFPHEAVSDGFITRHIPSTVIFSVELFTHGQEVDTGSGKYYINTATNDLEEFVNYLDSHYVNWICLENNIAIVQAGDVMETTAAMDANYEYRALQRFEIFFTQVSGGYTGVTESTASGGNSELFDLNDSYFTEIEINEEEP